jgi:FkbM family methyltransferase
LNVSHRSEPAILLYVGSNKGDDFVSEMRGWSKNSSFSVKDMQTATGSSGRVGNGPMDRACPAKEEVRAPPSEWLAQSPRPVQGFCIEPMQSTAGMLRDAFTRLGYFPAVTLIHAAVSSVPGRELFPASTAGAETLGLGSFSESFSEVDVITIDQLGASHNMAAIDVLSIDTEGNDMRVIFGAVHTLAAQKVRYLEDFPMGPIGPTGPCRFVGSAWVRLLLAGRPRLGRKPVGCLGGIPDFWQTVAIDRVLG